MINENLKQLRKSKGFTQEEVAIQLNVVRQTVSKWESGLSVPDSEMLIELSKLFEVPVAAILGESVDLIENTDTIKIISEKLALINEQFAKNAERKRKTLRGISIAGLVAVVVYTFVKLISLYLLPMLNRSGSTSVIGGADGATGIFVTVSDINVVSVITVIVLLAIFICGVCKTKTRTK